MTVPESFQVDSDAAQGCCVNITLRPAGDIEIAREKLAGTGKDRAVQVVTDGAGSLSGELAGELGITRLDSYIVHGYKALPESLCNHDEVYELIRAGVKVTTAQASTFERHQHYESMVRGSGKIKELVNGKNLYLCVGSAFTGNYDTVMAWKKGNDPDNNLIVIDTGAASGRLGLIALLTGRFVQAGNNNAEDTVRFAAKMVKQVCEYVFIDELKYLVRGGRLSKAGGFFGDLLHMKPVISPTADGVKKVGVVRSKKGQVEFALQKLKNMTFIKETPVILLQYSDNRQWVEDEVMPQIKEIISKAEIISVPLSLTSGVHMGPGTWAMATE